jgi:uncharacterized protein YbjT (DUF2867 family)
MSTVLIIGASRGIGLETVKLALKAGHSVRALARSATAIRLHDPKLEDGGALDQRTIERALKGVDAVIQTLGVSPTPEMILSGTHLFSVATRILVNAMEAATIKRLICVTGLGAGDSRGYGGALYNVASWLFLGRIYADKDAQEWIIRRSRLDWTIVRTSVISRPAHMSSFRAGRSRATAHGWQRSSSSVAMGSYRPCSSACEAEL